MKASPLHSCGFIPLRLAWASLSLECEKTDENDMEIERGESTHGRGKEKNILTR